MQASFYIIVHNGFSVNFSIIGSSAWWSRARMVCVTALGILVSQRNLTAMLEDSVTSVKTLYRLVSPVDVSAQDLSGWGQWNLCIDLMHWRHHHLHNNQSRRHVGGQVYRRAACTCCAERALAPSRAGPAVYGMQGLARWLYVWRWCTRQCLIWPPTSGGRPSGSMAWRHMHKVYYSKVKRSSVGQLHFKFIDVSYPWPCNEQWHLHASLKFCSVMLESI